MYNIFVEDNKIVGLGANTIKEDAVNIEVTKEQYDLILVKGLNYFVVVDNQIVLNPSYEQEENIKANAQRNREIDSKIKELQIMALPEVLNGNIENIKLYNEVIDGLEKARP